MIEQRIRDLSFWSSPVSISALTGGITNLNYLVESEDGKFVARACEDLLYLGIDRRNEIACQGAAARIGLAPAVVHHEDGIIVSDFVVGKTLAANDVRESECLVRIAEALRQLHDIADRLDGVLLYFSPFLAARTYAATARQVGATLPDELDDVIEDAGQLERQLGPFRPTLCHNDLLAANLIDTGDRVWIVDWEYAGVGHPMFDLAGLSANCELTDDQERALLETYHGAADSDTIREAQRELRVLKVVSLLREALWAFIQTVQSDLEFDYSKYARENLEAYRNARTELG